MDVSFTIRINLDAEKSQVKKPNESLDVFEHKKQERARDAVSNLPAIPCSPNSVSMPSSGEIVLGTGDQFPDYLLLRPLELELEDPGSQPTPANDTVNNLEQEIQGLGAQFAMTVDPRHDSALLENDLENLDSGNK